MQVTALFFAKKKKRVDKVSTLISQRNENYRLSLKHSRIADCNYLML